MAENAREASASERESEREREEDSDSVEGGGRVSWQHEARKLSYKIKLIIFLQLLRGSKLTLRGTERESEKREREEVCVCVCVFANNGDVVVIVMCTGNA